MEPKNNYNWAFEKEHCVANRHGTGTVTYGGKSAPCNFRFGQLHNGTNVVICDFTDSCGLEGFRIARGGVEKIEGVTSDGATFLTTNIFVFRFADGAACCHATDVQIQSADNLKPKTIRFGFTNLSFRGIGVLSIKAGTCDVRIVQVPEYEHLMERLELLQNVAITSHASFQFTDMTYIEDAIATTDILCFLLSVAMGTKIQWINYQILDESGLVVQERYCNRVTKEYITLKLLRCDEEVKRFVEDAWQTFLDRDAGFHLRRGLIDGYLDAKSEGDFLEFRGLKMAVVMEWIKSEFKKRNPAIKKAITQKTKQQNGFPEFLEYVREVCKEVGCSLSEAEMSLFVKCRNSLVHEADFYCQTATPKQTKVNAPAKTVAEEYFFLVNCLDRLIVRILGFSGEICDWRLPRTGDVPMMQV